MFPSITHPPDRFDIVLPGNTQQLLPDFTDVFFYNTIIPGRFQPPNALIDPFPVNDLPLSLIHIYRASTKKQMTDTTAMAIHTVF